MLVANTFHTWQNPRAFVLYIRSPVQEKTEILTMPASEPINSLHLYRNGSLIDATKKGNEARFINHSCDPNCQAEYWTVEGQERVGIFATKLIPTGQEITYDYLSICADEPIVK